MPKVSVIMPTYNCANYIRETLDTIFEQSFKDFEVLVIDDGSKDNTKDIIKKYQEKYPKKIYYIYQQNKGPAAARNNGIKNSKGNYIAFLDSDDLWLPEKLKEEVSFLDENPQYGFVFTDVYAIDSKGKLGQKMMDLKSPVSGNIFFQLLKENFVSLSTTLVRRECLEKVNGFSEDKEIISCEDHHLWLKVSRYYKGYYIDKPFSKYRIRNDNLSSSFIKQREAEIKVIDKIASAFPDQYKEGCCHFKHTKSLLYFEIGFKLYRSNDFKKASCCFILSLKEDIFAFKSLKLWLLLKLVPSSILKRRNLKIPEDETGLFDNLD